MNPIAGILLIAIGSIGAASFYVPFKKVKSWAWNHTGSVRVYLPG